MDKSFLERKFKLKENGTNVKTEIVAGITTFMTMAYILSVNPEILSSTGMDESAIFTATALSAIVATLVMGLIANYPFALAAGMGLNAFFAFTVVGQMGHSWEFALTAVLIEGILFLILTALNLREKIVNAIPVNIKHAISVGIGLFIAFIGLKNAGIIVSGGSIIELGNMVSPGPFVGIFGVIAIGVLLKLKVKGALLIGMLLTTLVAIPFGLVSNVPSGLSSVISKPPSIEPIAFKFVGLSEIFSLDMLVVLLTLLIVDMLDTLGTLVGVASKTNILRKDGTLPRAKQALFADAIGTTVGACLGTSTVTTYVESASGVAEGGRTGLTSVSTAGMFLIALFFAPVFAMIPAEATAAALIIVGCFMLSPIKNIDMDDFTELIPAFLTIIMMPLAFSIAEGIIFGISSYVFLKILTGKIKEVSLVSIGLTIVFIISYILPEIIS